MSGETLFKVTYGMYIVGSRSGDRLNGLIINTANQVTSSPPRVSVTISRNNLTHDYIMESKVFSISVLRKDTPLKFIGTWGFRSGRDIDKFQGTNYRIGGTGAPIVLDNAIGYMDLKLVNHMEVETHTIFIGEIVGSEMISDGEPLTYTYYRDIKGGHSSKLAPTYDGWADKPKGPASKDLSKYICQRCGYVYDPIAGDPGSDIGPNTPFSELPATWVCPLCRAGKDEFRLAN
ncbi:MAG: flavin reductase [Candidatus Thermoplasmatota archaeon]|nr:flavin reductase [Candidatus Thermoplasmatota archaeon]